MRLIETATDIQAPAARIWSILTDFPAYPAWNPFITAAAGELRPGARLSNSASGRASRNIQAHR